MNAFGGPRGQLEPLARTPIHLPQDAEDRGNEHRGFPRAVCRRKRDRDSPRTRRLRPRPYTPKLAALLQSDTRIAVDAARSHAVESEAALRVFRPHLCAQAAH